MTVVTLATEIAGAGPPIVLTHGLGDRASTWDAIWPHLVERHTVTRWDLRGHGHSGAPPARTAYSPDVAVEDLLTIIDRCTPPVTLVGHSLGGYLSLAVALCHPQLVRTLVLMSSGPGFRHPAARDDWNQYIDRVAQQMPIPPGAARLAHQIDATVIENLATLPCPLTQVVGEHDRRFHAGVAFVQRVLPATSTHIIAGASHHPQRTHPGEVIRVLEHATGTA